MALDTSIKRSIAPVALACAVFTFGAFAENSSWVIETVDDVDAGIFVHYSYTSIALDRQGFPHISYRGPSRDLRYATNRTGIWTPEIVSDSSTSLARESSIVIDHESLPHISFSFSDGHAEDLFYAQRDPEGLWTVVVVDATLSAGMESDIALDSIGSPHITHWNWGGKELRYSSMKSGGWQTQVVDTASWTRTALVLDSNDTVRLVYSKAGDLMNGTSEGGGAAVIDRGWAPSIAIDSQDHLHVTYDASTTLKYATNRSGSWQTETLASIDPGRSHSIAVDKNGIVHISYRNPETGALLYTWGQSGAWSTEIVDSGENIGHSNSIAVDSGSVHISYRHVNFKTEEFNGIWGSSASDIFVVGDEGSILHYDGASWVAMVSGGFWDLYGVWGSSPTDVFAVGRVILHYDGETWSEFDVVGTAYDVWGCSSANVFAVGSSGRIWHFDGVAWMEMESGSTRTLYGVWGTSCSNVFAVGSRGTVLHYDGASWEAMDSGTTWSLFAVWGSSPTSVFAVGSLGGVFHYNGDVWSSMASGVTNTLRGIWGSSSSNVFAVGAQGTIVHYEGLSWSGEASGVFDGLSDVWGADASSLFSAGYHHLLHREKGSWSNFVQHKVKYAVRIQPSIFGDDFETGDVSRWIGDLP